MPGGRVGRASEAVRLVELIKRVAHGHESGLTDLYDETSARVYGTALQMLRSPRLAAEVTQQVYVEIWQQASSYDPSKGSVLAWIMAMAHSHCVDRVRAVSRESAQERYVELDGDRQFDRASDEVESTLDAERASAGLRMLPEAQREAITLVYFKGYSQTEMARLLGLPLGTVKSRIRDGLIGLRKGLGVGT